MSSRKARPQHNDPHLNRMPYEQGPRQGRFGRVENWREAEKRQAEQIRKRRQEHSHKSRQTQAKAVSSQPANASLNDQRAARVHPEDTSAGTATQQQRKKPIEANPWQQGRFGRVENWRDEEAKRAQLQAEAEAAARVRAERAMQAREAAKAQKSAQASSGAAQQGQRRVAAQTNPPRQAAGVQSQVARAQVQHAQRQNQTAQRQHVEGVDSAKKAAYPVGQHSRLPQQGPASAAGAGEAKDYSRSKYVSKLHDKPVDTFSGAQSASSKFDRRPQVSSPSSRQKSLSGDLKMIPMKLVGALAVVIVFAVIVGFFTVGKGGEGFFGADGTASAQNTVSLPTPIMSESSGVTMHSAVAMEDLTEILIHNASYAYANEITTQLTEATNTDIIAAHGTGRDPSTQPTGDNWMTGEFIRCFRSGNAGPTMSAIDCGGPVGATVYAPVTGKVVLVKEYLLYDQIDDYRVHIQPTGRPDLDVVLIHLTDVTVKPGDEVTAGVTPIAKIRDIYQYLDDSLQLKQYTAESDNGNHTHIQVNNANHPEYTALNELKS